MSAVAWKLVPTELTQAMIDAGHAKGGLGLNTDERMGRLTCAWPALLDAAPAAGDMTSAEVSADPQGGGDPPPPSVGDAQIRASSEGSDQTASPLADVAARSLVDKSGPECRIGFTAPRAASHADFDSWLTSAYGALFEPIGDEEADTVSRIVKAVASRAWDAARRGGGR